jgi:drug/metabolite transporter (DMT)-like permease
MRAAYLRMHLAIFLWGFTGLLGKMIHLNEGLLVWYRMLLSSIIIGIILGFRKEWPLLPFKELRKLGGIGVLVMIHWVAFYGSIKLSSISVAMICLSSVALFASFIEPLVNGQRLDRIEVLFSAMAIGGISSIYVSDHSSAAGIIVGLVSSFFSALFSVLNRRIASKYEPLTISFIELSSGCVALTFLLPFFWKERPGMHTAPDQMDWTYLVILSLFCTVLTWVLSLQALRKVSAFTMALALNLEPVYGIILAVLFAGEGHVLNGGFIVGTFVILLTVTLHTLYRFKKKEKQGLST